MDIYFVSLSVTKVYIR